MTSWPDSKSASTHATPDDPVRLPAAAARTLKARSPKCLDRCPWCGRRATIIPVHGHGQCAACGVNREPCCQPD